MSRQRAILRVIGIVTLLSFLWTNSICVGELLISNNKLAATSQIVSVSEGLSRDSVLLELLFESRLLEELGIEDLSGIVNNMQILTEIGIICFVSYDGSGKKARYVFSNKGKKRIILRVTDRGEEVQDSFYRLLGMEGKREVIGDRQYELFEVTSENAVCINSFLRGLNEDWFVHLPATVDKVQDIISSVENPYWTDMKERVKGLKEYFDEDGRKIIDELQRPHDVCSTWMTVDLEKKDGSTYPAKIFMVRVKNNVVLGPAKGGIRYCTGKDLLSGDSGIFGDTLERLNRAGASQGEVEDFVAKWVSEETMALSLGMTLKNAGAGLDLGGGKGDVFIGQIVNEDGKWVLKDCDNWRFPRNLARIAIAHSRDLARKGMVGIDIDIPAPDLNTNPTILAWYTEEYLRFLMDETEEIKNTDPKLYRILTGILSEMLSQGAGEYDIDEVPLLEAATSYSRQGNPVPWIGVYTGKPVLLGGSLGRREATGFGGVDVMRILIGDLRGKTVAIQGFGKVGSYVALGLAREGAIVQYISDISVTLYKKEGFSIEELQDMIARPGDETLADYCSRIKVVAESRPKEDILVAGVDILIPAATENQIRKDNVDNIKAGIVVELANGPTTREAEKILYERGIPVIHDTLANAGGVIVSSFETEQAKKGKWYTEEEVGKRRRKILEEAAHRTKDTMERLGIGCYRTAGDICAVQRIVDKRRNITQAQDKDKDKDKDSDFRRLVKEIDKAQGSHLSRRMGPGGETKLVCTARLDSGKVVEITPGEWEPEEDIRIRLLEGLKPAAKRGVETQITEALGEGTLNGKEGIIKDYISRIQSIFEKLREIYGVGIFSMLEEIQIVEDLIIKGVCPEGRTPLASYKDGVLRIDITVLEGSPWLLFDALEHELIESIAGIIPGSDEVLADIVATFRNVKRFLTPGLGDIKDSVYQEGLLKGLYHSEGLIDLDDEYVILLERMRKIKDITDDEIIASVVRFVLHSKLYENVRDKLGLPEELSMQIKLLDPRIDDALQIFNEIAKAKGGKELVQKVKDMGELTISVVKTFSGLRVQGLDKISRRLAGIISNSIKVASKTDEILRPINRLQDDASRQFCIVLDRNRIPEGMEEEWKEAVEKLEKNRVFKVVYSMDEAMRSYTPKNIIHLIDPVDIKDKDEMSSGILYLPMPYLRSSLYMAAVVVSASGELDKIDMQVKGLIGDLYSQILGRDVTAGDLENLFTAPWLLLPEIKGVLEEIDNLRKVIKEIEKAA